MKTLSCLLGLTFVVASISAQTVPALNPLTSFGPFGNGQIDPGSFDPYPPMDSGNNQRGIAVDPVTGHLVLVDTHSGAGGSAAVQGNIFVLDGLSGAVISTLDTNGIAGGNYADAAVGVADDGAVYVCNQVTVSGSNPFIIYRWAGVHSTEPPTVAFSSTITPTQRYGATMDVRGAGADTQILVGSMPQGGSSGTDVVIFTTGDGLVFSAHVFSTDAAAANFQDGVAFGTGDTFWGKRIGAPLRRLSFDPGTSMATTLASYDSDSFPTAARLGPIAVDTANNLLAAIEVVAGVTGPEKVHLYDISDINRAPVLLDIRDHSPNNFANASAPPGFLDFHGGRLYSHVINNGLFAFDVASVSPPPPTFIVEPPASTRLFTGQNFTAPSTAYPAARYQWQKDEQNITDATNAVFEISGVQASDAGTYRVIATNDGGSATSSEAVLEVLNPEDLFHLNTLWITPPGTQPYVTIAGANIPNERFIGYNAVSNQLLVVQCAPGTSIVPTVHVVDGDTGAKLYNLNVNGIENTVSEVAGSNPINLLAIAVDEDGVVYACNETPNAAGGSDNDPSKKFRVYRWADTHPDTAPVKIFEGDPMGLSGNYRWGDVLNVRGAGLGTRILLDNHNNAPTPGDRYMAILSPTDETMTVWTSQAYVMDQSLPYGTTIGRSLEFGPGNTVFQKRRNAALLKSAFDPDWPPVPNGPAGGINEASYTGFPNTVGGVWMSPTASVVAGLNLQANNVTTPDSVNLYDATDLNAPLPIAQYNFPQNHINNANFIGWCVWSGNRLYALAGNNGIMAFELREGPPAPPGFLTQPGNLRLIEGGSGTLRVVLDQAGATLQWQKDGEDIPDATSNTFAISNAQFSDAGQYRVIAENAFGSSTSQVAVVTVAAPETVHRLSELWSQPIGSQPYLTPGASQTPFQRSLAYQPLTDELYIINRGDGLSISVLDPATGTKSGELNTVGIEPPDVDNLLLIMIAAAEDGAIYAGNVSLANNTTQVAKYRLYRWADSDPVTEPILVYEGEPANSTLALRWGDTMHVRGAGLNTEIIIDQQRNAQPAAAVLVPMDSSMSSFVSRPFSHSYSSLAIGRSIQFGAGNTVWQKNYAGGLQHSAYDLDAGTSIVLTNHHVFPGTLGGLALDFSRNIAAGVDFIGSTSAPDVLNFYDIADLNEPTLISTYAFPIVQQPNANHIAHTIFAGDRLFTLNANNGLMAFTILPPDTQPVLQLQISRSGESVNLSWESNTAILQATTTLTSPDWSDITSPGETSATQPISGGSMFYRLRSGQ